MLVGGSVLTPSRDLYWTVTMTDMDAHPYSSTLLPFQPHSPEPGHPPPPPCQGWVGGSFKDLFRLLDLHWLLPPPLGGSPGPLQRS